MRWQVYYFSKGKVKPANRNFSGVRNDYTINFDRECAPFPIIHQQWPARLPMQLSMPDAS